MGLSAMKACDADIVELRLKLDERLARTSRACTQTPHRLASAAEHSLLAPAKRLRGILLLLTARIGGGSVPDSLDAACAVEMVHAASLILDDLPCMDNATLRRGRPVNHTVYGEGTAILSAIGLMTEAFALVCRTDDLPVECRLEHVRLLSDAVGFSGLVSGQFEDLNGKAEITDLADLIRIHTRKTGVMFGAAAEMGGCASGADGQDRADLRQFGLSLGLAFQAYDDLIDVLSNRQSSGKDVGQDEVRVTLVSLLGVDGARAHAEHRLGEARAIAQSRGEWSGLCTFLDFVSEKILAQIIERAEQGATG